MKRALLALNLLLALLVLIPCSFPAEPSDSGRLSRLPVAVALNLTPLPCPTRSPAESFRSG